MKTCTTCGTQGIGDPRSCDHYGTPQFEGETEHDDRIEPVAWTNPDLVPLRWQAKCSCGWTADETRLAVESLGELRCHRAAVNHEGIA